VGQVEIAAQVDSADARCCRGRVRRGVVGQVVGLTVMLAVAWSIWSVVVVLAMLL